MTKTRLTLIPLSLTLAFGLACFGGKDFEGDEAGECNDGVDNDQNGLFDCDEDACVGSPLCEEIPTDDTGDGGGDDTGGGGGGGDEVTLLDVTYDCDAQGYFFDVNQSGKGSAPELYILESGSSNPYFEVHPFPSNPLESGPKGELYYMELDTVGSVGAVREGETTLFDCDFVDYISWIVVVYDSNGVIADCGAWGDNPREANEFFGTSCPTI